jgi:hypothetical protein
MDNIIEKLEKYYDKYVDFEKRDPADMEFQSILRELKTLEADNEELVECLKEVHSAVITVNAERGYIAEFDGEEVDFCRLDELINKHKPSKRD